MELRVERNTVLQQTVRMLRQAITGGRFKPGEKLVEADLCNLFGVSRTSLREALRRLEAERLVDVIPNRGPMIPIVPWEQAVQIYQTRRLLEGEVAALAARNARPPVHAQLAAALDAFRRAVSAEDAAGQISSTKHFYDVILECSGNRIIQELLEGLHARVSFLRGKSMSQPGRGEKSAVELAAIAHAITQNDEQGARAMAERHVDLALQAAREAYRRLSLPEA